MGGGFILPNVTTDRIAGSPEPVIACSLTTKDEVAARVADWHSVLAAATGRHVIEDGVGLRFAPGPALAADLARLAALEVGCCAWLTFAVVVSPEATTLEVRAPESGMEVVHSLFGTA